MFLVPRAGRTPIATTAVTATVRCMVVANGQVGVYGGGGFFNKSGTAGDDTFGGAVNQASLYLLHASPSFNDLMGPCEYSGSFMARKDDVSAAALARMMRVLMAQAPRVP